MDKLRNYLDSQGQHVAGIMVTNPNTGGIFESNFEEMADQIHRAGGLVYMDGANMNAIAGWVDLRALGVDAVHNNLHKTWTIPHGGGGPGDAIVAVGERLVDFLPGYQIEKVDGRYEPVKPKLSHRFFSPALGKLCPQDPLPHLPAAVGPIGHPSHVGCSRIIGSLPAQKAGTTFPQPTAEFRFGAPHA